MAVPLNKLPNGLLDFFGIKSGEWGPRELGQILSPTLELGRWYLDNYSLEVAVTVTGSPFAAAVAAGNLPLTSTTPVDLTAGGQILVPQDELWLILEATTGWFFLAPAVAGQSCDIWWTSRGASLPSTLQGHTTSDAAISRGGSRALERPYWARPGDQVGLNSGGIIPAAGTIQVSGGLIRLRIARFKI